MTDLQKLTQAILDFRNERDWAQFHTPKNLAISLSLEASEVLEHFQWGTDEEIKDYIKDHQEEIADELANVLAYLLVLADTIGIDNIIQATENKLKKNSVKYPVEKSKGSNKKYTEYI